MDWSPFEHTIIAASIMVLWGFVTGDYQAGACLGCGIFLGREHSEAEYRWMALNKVNRTGKEVMGAFSPAVWTVGSLLDWIAPCVVCCASWASFQ